MSPIWEPLRARRKNSSQYNKAIFGFQLDESTDVSNCMYLLVYCRYAHAAAGELKVKYLMCEETTSKAIDMRKKG